MTSSHEIEDRRLRRKTAAFRLKHDVGKVLRWSAPDKREADATALRARLAADLLPETSGGGAKKDVLKSFFEWKREDGPMFDSSDPDLQTVEKAMAEVRLLLPSLLPLEEISLSSLQSLDDACAEASRACTAFYRRVAVEEGPEVLRPFGGRGRRGDGS
ncbi:MAG: hypothetical protein ABI768_03980 [Acidobacteriota bacterium]